jgi:hypothetical protein
MKNVSKKIERNTRNSFNTLMCKKLRDRRGRAETLGNRVFAGESGPNQPALAVIIG